MENNNYTNNPGNYTNNPGGENSGGGPGYSGGGSVPGGGANARPRRPAAPQRPRSPGNARRVGGLIVLAAAVLVLIGVLSSAMYTVRQNQYAYVTRFSKMVSVEETPGLHFKVPFVDSVTKIPAQQMLYDITPSDVLTLDKKALVIDEICLWRIEDPYQFVRTLNASSSEAEARIDAAVYSAVKNEFGRLNREDIISTDQSSVQRVSRRVTEQVDAALRSYGISATVILKKTDLPTENQAAVFQRMIAERTLQSTSYLSSGNLEGARIRNDVDKQVEVIISEAKANAERRSGEAEARYMEILAEAYASPEKAEFYQFVRELDALRTAFEQSGSGVVILDERSEIAQALLGLRDGAVLPDADTVTVPAEAALPPAAGADAVPAEDGAD